MSLISGTGTPMARMFLTQPGPKSKKNRSLASSPRCWPPCCWPPCCCLRGPRGCWTVILGLGLALGEGSPAGKLAPGWPCWCCSVHRRAAGSPRPGRPVAECQWRTRQQPTIATLRESKLLYAPSGLARDPARYMSV